MNDNSGILERLTGLESRVTTAETNISNLANYYIGDRQYAFMTGTNGHVYYKYWYQDSLIHDWTDIGGALTTADMASWLRADY